MQMEALLLENIVVLNARFLQRSPYFFRKNVFTALYNLRFNNSFNLRENIQAHGTLQRNLRFEQRSKNHLSFL
jgi:hypothetical protein